MTATLKRRRVAERLAAKHLTAAPPKLGRPPMAFFYVRFSTAGQGAGFSAEAQIAECERVYERDLRPEGFVKSPIVYLDAGVSAFSNSFEKRPMGQKLLADIQKGDIVVAYKGDRMFRSLAHTIATMDYLYGMGVRLRLCDDKMPVDWGTAIGKLLFSVLGAVSEYDSSIKGERVKLSQRIAKQQGANFGPKPAFVETVYYRGRKRWVIKKPYVDALDWMAEQIRAPKPMPVDRLILETRKRMAAGEGIALDATKRYGLSRSQFYDSVRPRFANWSKETGISFTYVPQGQSEPVTRWLYPKMPENDKTQEG